MLKKASKKTNLPDNKDDHLNSLEKFVWEAKVPIYWFIVLVIAFILLSFYSYNQIKKLNDKNYNLSSSIQTIKSDIQAIRSDKSRSIIHAQYYGWSDKNNNVEWAWERSLWLPQEAKWKKCYLLGNKVDWTAWGTIRWYLGKDHNGSVYHFANNYQAEINASEQKIEITKWDWTSNKNLSKIERNNLYFSITMLCQ